MGVVREPVCSSKGSASWTAFVESPVKSLAPQVTGVNT